jgi:hypothetical protein
MGACKIEIPAHTEIPDDSSAAALEPPIYSASLDGGDVSAIGRWRSASDFECYQNLKIIKHLRFPEATSDFVLFWSCLYQTQIVQLVFVQIQTKNFKDKRNE